MTRHLTQAELDLRPMPGWGGSRPGAGRKAGRRARVWHRSRGATAARFPSHLTVRVRADVPSLRSVRLVRELERSFRARTQREAFRVVQYSIQHESHPHARRSRGLRSARLRHEERRRPHRTRRESRLQSPRSGSGRTLPSARTPHPREARAALAYVLLNSRKHAAKRSRDLPRSAARLDPAASGRWFDGWTSTTAQASDEPAVRAPRTWLLQRGWRRHGPIDPNEVPGTQVGNRRSPDRRRASRARTFRGRSRE